MTVTRIVADWLETLIADDAGVAAQAESIPEGSEASPEKISIVWSDDVDPICPPLHMHDLEYQVRMPGGIDLDEADLREVCDFIEDQFTTDNFDQLQTDLTGVGTLDDWFVGSTLHMETDDRDIVAASEIRLAIVHA
jgi:hypothetical protein